MGEAFDRAGHFLGSAEGQTRNEVLEKLQAQFGEKAHEIRIRSLKEEIGASVEMPRYKCHKEVHALKIVSVVLDSDTAQAEGRDTDGSAMLMPEDSRYAPFRVDAAFVRRHNPRESFYYVVYAPDGYASLSPIKAFEDGYTLIQGGRGRRRPGRRDRP